MPRIELMDIVELVYPSRGGEERTVIGEWNGIFAGIEYYGQAVVTIGWKQDDDTAESIPLERVLDVRYLGEYLAGRGLC